MVNSTELQQILDVIADRAENLRRAGVATIKVGDIEFILAGDHGTVEMPEADGEDSGNPWDNIPAGFEMVDQD